MEKFLILQFCFKVCEKNTSIGKYIAKIKHIFKDNTLYLKTLW